MARRGPGLLLRDIASGTDKQVAAAVAAIATARPDVLLLTGFDYDRGLAALTALRERLAKAGAPYPHLFALPPNSGVQSGVDLDGNGKIGGPRDAQGYGHFAGQGGMALLSRLPIDSGATRDFSRFLWRDLPGNQMAGAQLSPAARKVQRLASVGAWDVVLRRPDGSPLHLLAFAATPPVFDGPEDRNGRRNHDEIAFWQELLDGALPLAAPKGPFVLLGDANLDPVDGEGRHAAIRALLTGPRLQDPRPRSAGARAAAAPDHKGDPALTTADWSGKKGPGPLRVDYVLPAAGLKVTGAGVLWPAPGKPGAKTAEAASRHRLVWVELALP
ncbi:endonuclease/exonuclease/phosphatase family protein [Acidimangrovimonas pyrenivorans]|uniref:Endonuclease/exonuclease/phosphatase family protein n=1 Tax=Acidimangrovimonas pyrenivorans TaxID=2030798 RepID=A0ABV7AJ33_9RHOB